MLQGLHTKRDLEGFKLHKAERTMRRSNTVD